jgi:hypothetical protein
VPRPAAAKLASPITPLVTRALRRSKLPTSSRTSAPAVRMTAGRIAPSWTDGVAIAVAAAAITGCP